MSDRRQLSFKNEDELIAHIDRLRLGGYRKLGKWTLAMICQHLAGPDLGPIKPPASPTPTPQQAALKKGFIDLILETGKAPPGFEAPDEMTPKPTAGDADIERFKQILRDIRDFKHPLIDCGPFGPVPIEQWRALTLGHAAHHLSHLEPSPPSRRMTLQFTSEDEVIAELNKLRRGHVKCGGWSLSKMCAHLEKAVRARMQPGPFPPDTPEQEARKPILRQVLATGRLPSGIDAPPAMEPPDDAADMEIDALIKALDDLKRFRGQIAPHRIFGHLSDADARKLNLIHCAHHLSYLTPSNT